MEMSGEAYNFIVSNYYDGDEIYFFGFSRGACTAPPDLIVQVR